jgi:hypothetical protein
MSGYFANCMCVAVFVDGVGRGEVESLGVFLREFVPKAENGATDRG